MSPSVDSAGDAGVSWASIIPASELESFLSGKVVAGSGTPRPLQFFTRAVLANAIQSGEAFLRKAPLIAHRVFLRAHDRRS